MRILSCIISVLLMFVSPILGEEQNVRDTDIPSENPPGTRLGLTVGTPGLINLGGGVPTSISRVHTYFFGSILMALFADSDDDDEDSSDEEDDPFLLLFQLNADYNVIETKYFTLAPSVASGILLWDDGEGEFAGGIYAGPALHVFVWNLFCEVGVGYGAGHETETPSTIIGGFPLVQLGYMHKF